MFLETTWFVLWGLLWAIYFVTDGYDLGIGSLFPFLGKTETDKRVMINVIGPLWDGNEVWLITAGGVTFAAFPLMYAVMFSAFYTPLMILLFALIFRGVSFEYRGKVSSPRWRKFWDGCIFLGSILPAILLGVAFANIFRGIPIDGDHVFRGSLLTFLNPYGLLGGVLFLLMFLVHGASMLAAKTDGDMQQRAGATANVLWVGLLIAAVLCLISSAWATTLYKNGLVWLFILLAVAALVGTKYFLIKKDYWKAWMASGATMIGVTFFGVIGLYPEMLPSSLNHDYSITIENAASSHLTLTIMLVLAAIFVPVVIGYQVWANLMFKETVNEESLSYEESY